MPRVRGVAAGARSGDLSGGPLWLFTRPRSPVAGLLGRTPGDRVGPRSPGRTRTVAGRQRCGRGGRTAGAPRHACDRHAHPDGHQRPPYPATAQPTVPRRGHGPRQFAAGPHLLPRGGVAREEIDDGRARLLRHEGPGGRGIAEPPPAVGGEGVVDAADGVDAGIGGDGGGPGHAGDAALDLDRQRLRRREALTVRRDLPPPGTVAAEP